MPHQTTLLIALTCVAGTLSAQCVQIDESPDPGGSGRAWSVPERISGPMDRAASVAIDSFGNAFVVWTNEGNVVVRRYAVDDGWMDPKQVNRASLSRDDAGVAVGPEGGADVVWSQDFVEVNVYTIRYSSGVWGNSHRIDQDEGDGVEPQVSIGADGTAVAVWISGDGAREDVWGNRRPRGGVWGGPQRITTDADDVEGLRVAVAPDGSAIAVWAQEENGRFDIWSNRLSRDGAWDAAREIEKNSAGDARSPGIGLDDQGNAVVVWALSDGTRTDIWSNRYAVESGWGESALPVDGIEEGDATNPGVAVDGAGNAIAIWTHSDDGRLDLWSNRYTPSEGWGEPTRVESNDADSVSEPHVGIDQAGSAIAIWKQSDGSSQHVWSNRYTPSKGWGEPTPIDANGRASVSHSVSHVRLAVSRSGTAIAAWREFAASSPGIWASRLQ